MRRSLTQAKSGGLLKARARASRATFITTHKEEKYETRNSQSSDPGINCLPFRRCTGWKRPRSSAVADRHRAATDDFANDQLPDAAVEAQLGIRVNDEVAKPRLGRG